ncbi:MAG: type IV secretory system conjugative DNA transfer family protein [Paracoccaceae bacterium]|nr:type IV secretory system conjugative DNA transfer family protein [Paracoccaceae bacterium]
MEARKASIRESFQDRLDAAEAHTETEILRSDYLPIDEAQFRAPRVEDVPLQIDQSPIVADDPYAERISPTFLTHWWWLAVLSFVIWLSVQNAAQPQISHIYARIMRFLDEGRFGFGGSARFASMFEEWGKAFDPGTLYMGRSLYNPFDEIGLGGEAHMITVAGSRGGKGTTAIIPNLLLWKGSCVVVDPKGTNAHVTAEARRKMGHKVYLIDPFGIVTKDSDRFDPFANLDAQDALVRERIASIADALVIPDENAREKHWDEGARTIISGLISHVVSGQSGGERWLHTIRDLIKRLPEEQDRMWAEMSLNEAAGGFAKDAAMRYIRGSETNEILGIMSNADKHTEWLSSDVMRRVTSEPTFNLSDLKKEPTTVYLIIPPRQLTKQNRLIRLFINLMLDAMEDGGRSEVPVLMMIDEFLALERMPEVPTAFATMASYNLVIWLFVQDLMGLQKKYKNEFNGFIANSRAMQVFATTDDVTKEYVSKRLGNRPLTGLGGIAKSNDNVPIRAPDDIEKDLKANEGRQYVIEAGSPAMLIEKVAYFHERSRFAGKYAPDPDFAR